MLLSDLEWAHEQADFLANNGVAFTFFINRDGTYDILSDRREGPDWWNVDTLTAQCVLNYLVGLQ